MYCRRIQRNAAILNAFTSTLFAGTGDRVAKREQTAALMEMPDLDEMTKGSARIALEIDPAFARYVYIEKRQRCWIEEMLPPVSGAVPAPRRADDRRS